MLCKLFKTIITVQIFRFRLLVILRLNIVFLLKFPSDPKALSILRFKHSPFLRSLGFDGLNSLNLPRVCLHPLWKIRKICTIFKNRKVLFERQLFFYSYLFKFCVQRHCHQVEGLFLDHHHQKCMEIFYPHLFCWEVANHS